MVRPIRAKSIHTVRDDAALKRTILRASLATLLASSAMGEKTLTEQTQGMDQATPEQGWQTMQSAFDLGKIHGYAPRPSVWVQPDGADRQQSAQDAAGRRPLVPASAVAESPARDPRQEAEKRELLHDLARLRRWRNHVIAADVALWVGCAGSAAFAQVEVAAVVCCLAGAAIAPGNTSGRIS